MNEMLLTRNVILDALVEGLSPMKQVHVMWQSGAAAFGRVDEWSDIDLMIQVEEDEDSKQIFKVVEDILEGLGNVDFRFEPPRPAWHGLHQIFYRLDNTSPFLFLDIAIGEAENILPFARPEIHGEAMLLVVNKEDAFKPEPLDTKKQQEQMKTRSAFIGGQMALSKQLALKEIPRGNTIEAYQYYSSYTLRPLVELLRIKHCPERYNFHTRYIHYDLPADILKELEPLFFVQNMQDLEEKHLLAHEWIEQLLN